MIFQTLNTDEDKFVRDVRDNEFMVPMHMMMEPMEEQIQEADVSVRPESDEQLHISLLADVNYVMFGLLSAVCDEGDVSHEQSTLISDLHNTIQRLQQDDDDEDENWLTDIENSLTDG